MYLIKRSLLSFFLSLFYFLFLLRYLEKIESLEGIEIAWDIVR